MSPPPPASSLPDHPLHRALRAVARVAPELAGRLASYLFFVRPPRRRVTAGERAVLASGEHAAVATAAGRLAITTWGDGPVVLLVHGWGGRGSQLAAFVSPLVVAGYRVVAVDLPGHGASPGRRTNLVVWADALVDLARAVGAPGAAVHGVLAHSFGGAAVALALHRGLAARRLALVAPVAEPFAYFRGWVGGVLGHGRRFGQAVERVERRLGVGFAELAVPRLAAGLAVEGLPLLVVHDEGDRETPLAGGQAIAAAWPGAELVTTSGLGHNRILQAPAVVARVVGHLAVPADGERCRRAGCGRPAELERAPHAPTGGLCDRCALEHELAHPHLRWPGGVLA